MPPKNDIYTKLSWLTTLTTKVQYPFSLNGPGTGLLIYINVSIYQRVSEFMNVPTNDTKDCLSWLIYCLITKGW